MASKVFVTSKTLLGPLLLTTYTALFFEVKTVNQKNLLDQVRAAIGQLLEYRFIYREAFDRVHLALVAPPLGPPSEVTFANDFLKDCSIDWVSWLPDESQFKSLQGILDSFYHSTRYTSNTTRSISP